MKQNRHSEFSKSCLIIAALGCYPVALAQSTLSLNVGQATYTIKREIYGALMENWGRDIYTGVYVGENSPIPNTNGIRNDVIEAFKEAGVSCLDWPGGCFAERYEWSNGIGPKKDRPGGDCDRGTGSDGFGTDEYFQLCDLVGSIPYITANIFVSTANQTAWLNYIDEHFPGKLVYWKIGNEPWGGCSGYEYAINKYLDKYEEFEATIPQQFAGKLYRIADGGSGNGLGDYWLDAVMKRVMGKAEGVTYHYYSGLNGSGPSMNFSQAEYYSRLRLGWAIDSCMNTCERIMNQYDPEYSVDLLVDEWGAWYSGLSGMGSCYQQNTCRDAVIASMHFNIFNNRCRRVKMALVAQPVNVIQSLLLTANPPTTDMIKTPTFYVFKMYKVHQEATMVPVTQAPEKNERVPIINASASVDSTGILHISMCNSHISDKRNVTVTLNNAPPYKSCTATVINGPKYDSYNDYKGVEPVNIQTLPAADYSLSGSSLTVSVPAHSVVTLALTPSETTGVDRVNRQDHGAWSVTPLSGGAVRLHTSASEAVPAMLTLIGIDGRKVTASDLMTVTPGGTGIIWHPAKEKYYAGVYILRITTEKGATTYRVALTR
ncbi:MAG: hypothetical protein JW863_10510 [Chitinispirillaceae bacterium]|nr:hypothetical protein [Chitinispirillaceae bacterium]